MAMGASRVLGKVALFLFYDSSSCEFVTRFPQIFDKQHILLCSLDTRLNRNCSPKALGIQQA